MAKEELITKQQLEIEEYEKQIEENKKLLKKIRLQFIAIGAPLNDNSLQFNNKQIAWCANVLEMIEQINCTMLDYSGAEEG